MLDFELAEEHLMLQASVREWAGRDVAPRIRDLDRSHTFDRSLLPRMAALGLLGISIPTEFGGSGMDYVALGVASEELEYVRERRRALGGPVPSRRRSAPALPAPGPKVFDEFAAGSGGRASASTTTAFTRLLRGAGSRACRYSGGIRVMASMRSVGACNAGSSTTSPRAMAPREMASPARLSAQRSPATPRVTVIRTTASRSPSAASTAATLAAPLGSATTLACSKSQRTAPAISSISRSNGPLPLITRQYRWAFEAAATRAPSIICFWGSKL